MKVHHNNINTFVTSFLHHRILSPCTKSRDSAPWPIQGVMVIQVPTPPLPLCHYRQPDTEAAPDTLSHLIHAIHKMLHIFIIKPRSLHYLTGHIHQEARFRPIHITPGYPDGHSSSSHSPMSNKSKM